MPIIENTDFSFGNTVPFFSKQPKLSKDKVSISVDRAIQKALSFRVLATIGTFAVTYAFTGNVAAGVGISTAQAVTNTTLYYLHERMWDKNVPIKEAK